MYQGVTLDLNQRVVTTRSIEDNVVEHNNSTRNSSFCWRKMESKVLIMTHQKRSESSLIASSANACDDDVALIKPRTEDLCHSRSKRIFGCRVVEPGHRYVV